MAAKISLFVKKILYKTDKINVVLYVFKQEKFDSNIKDVK